MADAPGATSGSGMLKALLKEQRAKVEEIKKKTNFSRPPGPSTANPNPNGNQNPNNINTGNKSRIRDTAPPPPPQRKWFDAVADLLVGAEDPALARDKFRAQRTCIGGDVG
ncbi:hypothetical protein C8R44DRAFT_754579 [Mycena epipterygia]|nr:hypothetical protein C8R44DRAFT_754579 [Mycena epipterygia]